MDHSQEAEGSQGEGAARSRREARRPDGEREFRRAGKDDGVDGGREGLREIVKIEIPDEPDVTGPGPTDKAREVARAAIRMGRLRKSADPGRMTILPWSVGEQILKSAEALAAGRLPDSLRVDRSTCDRTHRSDAVQAVAHSPAACPEPRGLEITPGVAALLAAKPEDIADRIARLGTPVPADEVPRSVLERFASQVPVEVRVCPGSEITPEVAAGLVQAVKDAPRPEVLEDPASDVCRECGIPGTSLVGGRCALCFKRAEDARVETLGRLADAMTNLRLGLEALTSAATEMSDAVRLFAEAERDRRR